MWTPDKSIIITTAQRAEKDRIERNDAIKAECRRRILLILTEDEQRNTLAESQKIIMLYGSDISKWPEEIRTRYKTIMDSWTEIERLRFKSNELERLPSTTAITSIVEEKFWK